MSRSVRFALLIAAVVGSTISVAGTAHARAATTFDVFPGDSIQAAINAASPGDKVVVHPGVYHESLLIKKNDIRLWGSGASTKGTVLEPPKSSKRCMHGGSGICIFGTKAGGPVSGVRVQGFLVQGFHVFGLVGFVFAVTMLEREVRVGVAGLENLPHPEATGPVGPTAEFA